LRKPSPSEFFDWRDLAFEEKMKTAEARNREEEFFNSRVRASKVLG
jgi:hypothetical protein